MAKFKRMEGVKHMADEKDKDLQEEPEKMNPEDVEIIEPKPKKKKKENPVDKPLTAKQEAFVQNLVSGHTKYESYILAYPKAANWPQNSASVEANKLLKKPNVKARYEALLAQYTMHVTVQSFYGRDQLLEDFMYLKDEAQKSIDQTGVRQANSNAYASALRNIGEILNLYPDKRLDINATVSNDFEVNIFNDADDETKDKHR